MAFVMFVAMVFGIHILTEGETLYTIDILYGFLVLFVFFFTLLFEPICASFDKTSITIYFSFGFYQKIDWESVHKIEMVFQSKRWYCIHGKPYGKKAFFTSTKIPATRKAERLLAEFTDGIYEK